MVLLLVQETCSEASDLLERAPVAVHTSGVSLHQAPTHPNYSMCKLATNMLAIWDKPGARGRQGRVVGAHTSREICPQEGHTLLMVRDLALTLSNMWDSLRGARKLLASWRKTRRKCSAG
jgi:hypothetical protein